MLSGEVLEWWWYISGKVTYNYPYVFVQTPTESCEWALKEDIKISVQIAKPTAGSTIGSTFSLWFGVQSPKNIRKVSVSIDDTYITSFTYAWQTKTLTDLKDVTLLTGIKNWSHKLLVRAFDFAGFSNLAQIDIKVNQDLETPNTPTDKTAPKLLEDQIKIEKLEDGKYNVTLKFSDDSGISKSKIVNNWTTLKEFSTDSVTFLIDSLVPVSLEVTDASGNKLTTSIDLSTYYKE